MPLDLVAGVAGTGAAGPPLVGTIATAAGSPPVSSLHVSLKRAPVVVAQRTAETVYQGHGPAVVTTKLRLNCSQPVWLSGVHVDSTCGASGIIKLFRAAVAPASRRTYTLDADAGAGGDAPLAVAGAGGDALAADAGAGRTGHDAFRAAEFACPVLVEPGVDYCVLFASSARGAERGYYYADGRGTVPVSVCSYSVGSEPRIAIGAGMIARDSPAVEWSLTEEADASGYAGSNSRYRIISALKCSLTLA